MPWRARATLGKWTIQLSTLFLWTTLCAVWATVFHWSFRWGIAFTLVIVPTLVRNVAEMIHWKARRVPMTLRDAFWSFAESFVIGAIAVAWDLLVGSCLLGVGYWILSFFSARRLDVGSTAMFFLTLLIGLPFGIQVLRKTWPW